MGHRLSKIYTRTGDQGDTGLGDGTRVSKDDLRVEAYGTLDELNSFLGLMIAANSLPDFLKQLLLQIQNHLFDVGSELCLPEYRAITQDHVVLLENQLDALNQELKPLKEFLLPGGHVSAAHCHVARTVCRRAERCVITMAKDYQANPQSIKYLNRLSDLLFVIARYINHHHQIPEPLWQHEQVKKG